MTKSLISASSPIGSTNRSSAILAVLVAILVIGAGAAGFYVSGSSHPKSTTSRSSSTAIVEAFTINYDTLTVGFKGGLFELGFQSIEGKPVLGVVTVIYTPVQAILCSGASSGLSFTQCLPGANKGYTYTPTTGGSFTANTTFSGFDSGAGPGSAIPGQNYTLSIKAWYTDGTMASQNFTVPAIAGA